MASSFGSAFAAARKKHGPGKTFKWKGKSYSTNTKEDEDKKNAPTKEAPKSSKRPDSRRASVSRAAGRSAKETVNASTRPIADPGMLDRNMKAERKEPPKTRPKPRPAPKKEDSKKEDSKPAPKKGGGVYGSNRAAYEASPLARIIRRVRGKKNK